MTHDFVGAGWAFPLGVDARGGIALARRDQEHVLVLCLFLVSFLGVWSLRFVFGFWLCDFVFRSATVDTAAELANEVQNALLRWEPRVVCEAVNVTVDPEERNRLYIDVYYTVKGTNDRRNLVFPFYTIPDDGSDY